MSCTITTDNGTNWTQIWEAINDGYDYAIGLPLEFFAENTDTLMHHALKCYENFDNYDPSEPIDYPDWSVPYSREIVQGKTHVIYNGVPVGKYKKHVIEAFYLAIDSVTALGRYTSVHELAGYGQFF